MSSLAVFAAKKPQRIVTINHDGADAQGNKASITLTVKGKPYGDDYGAVLFADGMKAYHASTQNAALNQRFGVGDNGEQTIDNYPMSLYGDVIGILKTLQVPEGDEPHQEHTIYALYDNDFALFCKLRGAMYEVLGIVDVAKTASGEHAWRETWKHAKLAQIAMRKGEPATALTYVSLVMDTCAGALTDYGVTVNESEDDHPDDIDPTMEALLGEASAVQSTANDGA